MVGQLSPESLVLGGVHALPDWEDAVLEVKLWEGQITDGSTEQDPSRLRDRQDRYVFCSRKVGRTPSSPRRKECQGDLRDQSSARQTGASEQVSSQAERLEGGGRRRA